MHSSDFEVYFLQLLPPISSLVCVFLTRITKLKTTHRSDRLSHITRAINNAGPSVCDSLWPQHVIIFSILSIIGPGSGEDVVSTQIAHRILMDLLSPVSRVKCCN